MNAPPDGLRYGSVCSGIEAVALAWRPLGWQPAWLSEIDPFANAVLAHHYPDLPNLGDMTRIADAVLEGAVLAPDILIGGTPCQAFSIAGHRKGLSDPRGALTLKYVELANAIDQVRSKEARPSAVLVWENVPGCLSDRGNAFGCFLAALVGEERALESAGPRWTNAGCVYGPQRAVAWRVLDAQYFGVAQRRKRVFLVASARADFDPAAVLFECAGLCGDSASGGEAREDASGPPSSCAACESGAPEGAGDGPRAREEVIPCFGGGNANGPIERAACLTARGHKCDFEVETFAVQSFSGLITHALNTANNGKGSSEDGTGRGIPVVASTRRGDIQAMCGDVAHPLTCATAVTEDGNGRGVPIVSLQYSAARAPCGDERDVMAFAQNSRGELRLEGGEGQRVGALSTGGGIPGQGMPVIAHAPVSSSPTDALSFEAHLELRARRDPSRPVSWWQQWQVRRLMPLECERLQGLPDNYTLVPWRGALAPDGPRYRAIGNSMAVPCVAWIGRRLHRVLARPSAPR